MAMARSPRTAYGVVDASALYSALEPFATLKNPRFDWSVQGCAKTRRSQGPDHDGLVAYRVLLRTVLEHAPSGFPPLVVLRQVLKELHRKHEIKPPPEPMSLEAWANRVGDTIRLMTKHLRQVKEGGHSYVSVGLEDLLSLIDTSSASPPAPSSMPLPPVPESGARVLQRVSSAVSSAGSVLFCGAKCNCPECRSQVNVQSSQEPPLSQAIGEAGAILDEPAGPQTFDQQAFNNTAAVPLSKKPAAPSPDSSVKKRPAAADPGAPPRGLCHS